MNTNEKIMEIAAKSASKYYSTSFGHIGYEDLLQEAAIAIANQLLKTPDQTIEFLYVCGKNRIGNVIKAYNRQKRGGLETKVFIDDPDDHTHITDENENIITLIEDKEFRDICCKSKNPKWTNFNQAIYDGCTKSEALERSGMHCSTEYRTRKERRNFMSRGLVETFS